MYKLGPVLIFPSREKAGAMGRPSLRTPEMVAKICAAIRERGHTDTHAAALAGVSSSAVSRWRQEDEEFARQLVAARADFLDARLLAISETRKRDGSLDWRAQAWLMQAVAPEVYGPPSRRHALARGKEKEQPRAEDVPKDNPHVITKEDLKYMQQWRAYKVHTMNGMGKEEALWRAHFGHDDNPPPFPGSLAAGGAELAPQPVPTPEEEVQFASLRRRREVALRAQLKQDEAMGRDTAWIRRELTKVVEDNATEDGGDDVKESGPEVLSVVEGPESQVLSAVEGGPCPEFQNAANLPESRTPAPVGGEFSKTTNLPESRADTESGETRDGGAPTPWTGAPPAEGGTRRDAGAPHGDAVPVKESWHDFVTRISAGRIPQHLDELTSADAARNATNLPESRGEGPEGERLAHGEIGVARAARRPLTGAARAAVEAKEWRRINRLVEEQFQRSTDRAMAVAEAAERDAIPGMWAGF